MDEKELKTRLNALYDNYINDRKKLLSEFAKSNEKYKVGDVLQSKATGMRLRISKIVYHFSTNDCNYQTIYHGKTVLKNGKEGKKEDVIYAHDIVE